MFSDLTNKIVSAVKNLGRSNNQESQIEVVIRQIRIALLESDVSLSATKKLINSVREKIASTETPKINSDFVINILQDEIIVLLGGQEALKNKYKAKREQEEKKQALHSNLTDAPNNQKTSVNKSKDADILKNMVKKAGFHMGDIGKGMEEIINRVDAAKKPKKLSLFYNSNSKPSIIMMIGLQGSGKTTSVAKLAHHLKSEFNKKVLVVGMDVYRPAAYKQLEVLASSANFTLMDNGGATEIQEIIKKYQQFIAKQAKKQKEQNITNDNNEIKENFGAYNQQIDDNINSSVRHQQQQKINSDTEKESDFMYDFVIFDTAGRTVLDEQMMEELKEIHDVIKPNEVLLVVDSLLGQSATNIAQSFNEAVPVSGLILTRIDSDTRGGAALSLRTVLDNVPIKFLACGEKYSDLELFDPERISAIIMGKGDIESILKKTEENFKGLKADKIKSGKVDFDEMLSQLKGIKKMGNLSGIISMLPAQFSGIKGKIGELSDNRSIDKMIAMINSMTKEERANPRFIIRDSSRRRRICEGAGCRNKDFDFLLDFYKKIKDFAEKMLSLKGKESMFDIIGKMMPKK